MRTVSILPTTFQCDIAIAYPTQCECSSQAQGFIELAQKAVSNHSREARLKK